ncbi:DNA-binding SARP family transcriptional activator [Saccharothrix carnea]|uniref:DNA-binding SARP family transcriptional activator n=1 Tax=Saccharothrix carnea TaxID=1280637 RepID=A0A2P8I8E3_SACCR|nr:BTAD domain-containing putative transcriptional regulator [Saccharothrix carnea]PSL54749.1 DNA-binding SARP family transcriptional activator [Saccharothrix carnea]
MTAVGKTTTRFNVLGPLEVWHGDVLVPVPAGRARLLLAVLLLDANRPVPADDLVDRLWDGRVPNPDRAKATLQMVVRRLRQALGEANVVRTTTNGYLAEVPPDALDLTRFRDLAGRGRFAEALALWRGEPLSDVRSDVLHAEAVAPLLEERLTALERRIDADLAAGRTGELVAELRVLTGRYPLRERFWGQFMLALAGSDRQAEALAAYDALRGRLVDELGVDPAPRLQELYQRILTSGPTAAAGGQAVPVPRQLPVHTRFFVGRRHELDVLGGLLDAAPADGGAVVISAVDGAAGIGKTTLALHWAARHGDRFPDGQLYVDLRGFDPSGAPVGPDEALRGFLGALGVAREGLPSTSDELVNLYRGAMADRRILVVLDNACDSEQVRPLLPSGPGCFTVVTSRRRLDGLIVREGARPLALGVLADADAFALLERQLGADRVAAEPGAARDVVEHCAGLPLALAVVAARAAAHPEFPLRALADELADERTRLDALDIGDDAVSVKAVFSWSSERLTPAARRVFELLGLHPGPEVSVPAVASLAGIAVREARACLRELSGMNLLVEHRPSRFSLHDLVHTYAREVVAERVDEPARRAAVHRLLDHYLHAVAAVESVRAPYRDTEVVLDPPLPGVVVTGAADHDDALAWLELEKATVFRVVEHAFRHGFDAHTWRLTASITSFCGRRGYWQEALRCHRFALDAARRLGDDAAQATAHRGLGRIHRTLEHSGESESHLEQALELAAGDPRARANLHGDLAILYEYDERHADALHHAQQALRLREELGDAASYRRMLNSVGWLHALLGDHRTALDHCLRSLALHQETGDDQAGEAAIWDSLGYINHHLDDLGEAARCYENALAQYRAVGERFEEAMTLDRLGDTLHAAGDGAAARRRWQEAVVVLDDLGHSAADRIRPKVG